MDFLYNTLKVAIVVSFLPCLAAFLEFHPYMVLVTCCHVLSYRKLWLAKDLKTSKAV